MSLKALLLSLPLFAALLITAGCSSAAKLGGVTIAITELTPGPTPNTLQAKLSYKNENVLALAITETTHTLYLNGTKIAKLNSDIPVGLPPVGMATQTVVFPVKDSSVIPPASANIAYRLSSALYLVAGEDDTITIKTSSSGTVSLSAPKK